VTFRRRVRLDPRQIRDLRGRGVGGRGVVLAGGGGAVGIIVLVIFVLLGGDPGQLGMPVTDLSGGPGQQSGLEHCQTGEDANKYADCRAVGFANSIQAYWMEADLPGLTYVVAPTTLFDGMVDSGCGLATAEVGPFYCPADGSVYLDLTFFDDLRTRLGARGGPFAEGYVIAHEYGHHVQDLQGLLRLAGGDVGEGSRAVATELQADCYAGVWAAHAASTGFLAPPTDREVALALDAAAAVGDDRIQRRSTGQVDPESWTHGSSEQRQAAYLLGYREGEPGDCRLS
jgi:predicted metalloprotease